jgi:phage tail-like protein
MAENRRVSSYLTYLPALFQPDSAFVGRFLLAFERILSGLSPLDADDPIPLQPGLEEILDHIQTYFIPGPGIAEGQRAPTDFLPWLASWVALSLREDWEEEEKRRFISRIAPLYQYRGTLQGLKELLQTYTGEAATVYECDQPPHYFQVEMTLSEPTPERLRRKEKIARAIIDQEKPAHTVYALRILIPTMQIVNEAEHDTERRRGIWVGKTTVLGTKTSSGEA